MTEKESEKNKKLNELQTRHRRLLTERIPLQEDYKKKTKIAARAQKLLNDKNQELHAVGEAIYAMKHSGLTPHVTDHAIVRYLERVKGVDIWALRDEVAGNANAVKEGNVIVTVNEDLSEVISD